MYKKKSSTAANGHLRRVAIYIRVSTDAQAKKGDSTSEQMETLQNYVNSNNDLILYDVYIDDGVSGQKLNRSDFTRLMDDVKNGNIDLIIFTKLDRWFRSLRHYLNTQALLEKHNVAWLAVSQPYYDTSTPQGRAFVAQSMTFAELEAQNDSVRVRDVFNYKYKHGEVLSGSVPLGYSIQNKHMVLNEDADKALATFKFYDRVGSLNATIIFLEKEYGIVMTQANLKKSILQNTKYIGKYRDNTEFCPAIIPRDLFESVQNKLQHNIKHSQRYSYIFSGLTSCACCGHSMSGAIINRKKRDNSGEKYKYPVYRCHIAYPSKRCVNRKNIFESTLERYVLENIKPLLSEHLIDYDIKNAPVVDNKQKQATLLRKIDKLKELYVNDAITLEEFKKDRARYMEQIEALTTVEAPAKDLTNLRDFLKMDIAAIYDTMTSEEKRYLWRSVIKEIRIDDKHNYQIIFL